MNKRLRDHQKSLARSQGGTNLSSKCASHEYPGSDTVEGVGVDHNEDGGNMGYAQGEFQQRDDMDD